jgi:predicted enzyme related to lactoylglutathione lyase
MHGLFEWVDVSVPDLDRGLAFYEALFGWEAEVLADGGDDYRLLRKGDRLAAGIVRSGTPGWNSYITVDSLEDIRERAEAAGAMIAVPPTGHGDQGRLMWVIDPAGAGIGFWEPGTHRGADAYNEPGFLTWNELRTNDHDGAVGFYEQLFPEWSFHDQGIEGVQYSMVQLGDRLNAAIAPLGEHFDDMEAHWAVWFTVADAAADVARLGELGGTALGDVVETSYGPAARIADPFGTAFLIIGPMAVPDDA